MARMWRKALFPSRRRRALRGNEAPPLLSLRARLWRRLALRRTRLVAVTGSFGKTTTTRAIHAALGLPLHRLIDLNNPYFAARALLELRPGQKRAVIELGINRPGNMAAQIDMLRPEIGVVTWIGGEHLTSFGSLDRIADEKSLLVRALPGNGLAVLNGDDPRVAAMARLARCRVATFGLGDACDFRAENMEMDWPRGTRFDLVWGDVRRPAYVPILGKPAVYAALAALAVALSEGQSADAAVEGLARTQGKAGRLFPVELPGGAWLLRDEFKGAMATYDAALDALAEIPATRRLALLGEFSEGDGETPRDSMRRISGRAAGLVSELIFFGSRKSAQPFRAGARAGGLAEPNIHFIHRDFARCVSLMRGLLRPGDVLLIKARHEVRLDRVALALMGRDVHCAIPVCPLKYTRCDVCPKLEKGWGEARESADEATPNGRGPNDG